jgi:hypothetical protein
MDQPEVIAPRPRYGNVIAIVERSALARGGRRVIEFVERASQASRAGRTTRELAAGWRALGQPAHLHAIGTMLIAAVAVHLAITVVHRVPPGWMWLVIPGIALVQGVVLLAAGRGQLRNS